MRVLIKTFCCLLLFLTQQIYAQSTPSCGGVSPNSSALPSWYTPDWDWTDATPSNWVGNISVLTGSLTMGCPFTSNTNTDDLIKVINGMDYWPEQGWTLLAKDFGVVNESYANNATPYFILYNKYKSIIRLFIYYGNTSPNVNRASVILKWSSTNSPSDNNSMLTHANGFSLANENYPIANNPEKHVNYMNQVSYSGAWGVTEYLVNFDPNTVKNDGNFQYMNFDFKLSNTSTVTLSGDFNFSTESATAKNPPTAVPNGGNPNLLDYVVTGKAALAKAPKKSEVIAGFAAIAAKTNTIDEKFCNNFTRDLSNVNNSLQNGKLKQYLIGAAGLAEEVGGLLGTVGSVLELFMSKSNTSVATSNESYIQPTISKGTMNLNGTITSESNPLSISIQLPGTSHKYSDGTINCPNLPVYDCPMGVISLQEAPGIEVRTRTEAARAGYFACSIDYGLASPSGCPPSSLPLGVTEYSLGPCGVNTTLYRRYTQCSASFPTKIVKSYKVTGDIRLALNAQAGVVIESTKAALYFQIKDNAGSPAFDLMQTDITPTLCLDPTNLIPLACGLFDPQTCRPNNSQPFNPITNFVETSPFINYTKNLLNAGDLKLSNFDNLNRLHSFQTPFIDIDKFKNTAVTIEDGCNVYLKLLITLRPSNLNDDQTPIVYLATYQLPANKFTADNSQTPYVMTCEQRREEDTLFIGQANTTFTTSYASYIGISIKTPSNSVISVNSTFSSSLQAYSSIKLTPDFKTQLQPGFSFRAYLNPNTQGCSTSANALVVQTHTFDCANNAANNRFALVAWQNAENEGLYKATPAENIQNLYLKIAPNPSNGNFKLLFSKSVNNGTVKIYNNMAQEVYRQELTQETDSYELNLNGHLTPGAYYLNWNNTIFVINQKFIVE